MLPKEFLVQFSIDSKDVKRNKICFGNETAWKNILKSQNTFKIGSVLFFFNEKENP